MLKEKALQLRREVLEMCSKAGTGHVTSSYSCVEILVALYYEIMGDDDKFILSKGQASPILYAILADLGHFPKEWMNTFCQKGGKFGVHLQHDVPGVEITAGSLGHGFGIAVGMALAKQKDMAKGIVYTLLGDGELYEGSMWETAMFASHNRLSNLVAIVDRNSICATNYISAGLDIEPLEDKFMSFGWDVLTIDGHDFDEVLDALKVRSRRSVNPLVIIAETIKGKGIDFISDDPRWHARCPNGEEIERAREELK